MEREKFVKLVEEALDALPGRFRKRMHNVSVLVENVPPEQLSHRGSRNAGIADPDDADSLSSESSRAYPQLGKACLTCLPVPTASCFIRRTSRPFAPMKTKSPGSPSNSDPRTRPLFRDDRSFSWKTSKSHKQPITVSGILCSHDCKETTYRIAITLF